MTKRVFNFFLIFLLILSFNIGSVFAAVCPICNFSGDLARHDCTNNELNVSGNETLDPDTFGNYTITIGALPAETGEDIGVGILEKYRTAISILAGVGTLTMILFFVLNFVKLAKSSDNPQQRQSAMIGIIFTGCATVLLGGVMTFFTFFYNFL